MNSIIRNQVANPPIDEFKTKIAAIRPGFTEVIDLSQAVPNFPTFAPIRERLATFVCSEEASFYTEIAGLAELRQIIADEHPLKALLHRDSVLITAGANHAMFTALLSFLEPGATVVLPEPYYFNYEMAIRMLGLRPSHFLLKSQEAFQFSPEALVEFAKQNQASAIVLVSPNNPTGVSYSADTLCKLSHLCADAKVFLFVDETYRDFDPEHLQSSSSWNLSSTVFVGSFSKSFSLTGYRVGYLLADPTMIDQAKKVQDTLVICAPRVAQVAALFGLRHAKSLMQDQIQRIQERQDFLVRLFQKHLQRFDLVSSGGFFAYIRHPFTELDSGQVALKLYEQTGIIGLPGQIFGSSQNQFLRLAYANVSESQLEKASQRLANFELNCLLG